MKITANKAVDLLKKLGLQDVVLVDDEASVDFNESEAIEALDNARTPVIRTKIEQTLRDEITNRVTGTAGDKLRKALKELTGIAAADLKDLDDRAAVEKAIAHYASTLSSDSDKAKQQIDEMLAAHNKTLQDKENEYKTQLNALQRKITDRVVNEKIAEALKDAPFPEGADRNRLASLYKAHLEELYDIDIDESNNAVSLFVKNTKTPALSSDKNHLVSIADHREGYFTPLGLWKKDLRDERPPAGGDPYKPENGKGNPSNAGKDPLRESAIALADRMGS